LGEGPDAHAGDLPPAGPRNAPTAQRSSDGNKWTACPTNCECRLSGAIVKRSEWIGSWNVRKAEVVQPLLSNPTPGGNRSSGDIATSFMVQWSGGATNGHMQLDAHCKVTLAGDELFLERGAHTGSYGQSIPKRSLFFRAAPGGPTLQEWHDSLSSAIATAGGGCCAPSPTA
jgi:hypothetical protein